MIAKQSLNDWAKTPFSFSLVEKCTIWESLLTGKSNNSSN